MVGNRSPPVCIQWAGPCAPKSHTRRARLNMLSCLSYRLRAISERAACKWPLTIVLPTTSWLGGYRFYTGGFFTAASLESFAKESGFSVLEHKPRENLEAWTQRMEAMCTACL